MEQHRTAVVVDCLKIDKLSDSVYEMMYRLSTQERQEKANRYRKREDSERCLAAGMLLQAALLDTQGVCKLPSVYGIHGKPQTEGAEGFHYNISHAGEWVVLAYSDKEVGVDVERIFMDEGRKKVAEFSFAEEEQNYIFESENEQAERFSKVWTLKESYLKYLGTGMTKDMKSFVVNGGLSVLEAEGQKQEIMFNSMFLDRQHCLSICGEYQGIVVNITTLEELITQIAEAEERVG